ncbi:receptor-type tyrosine-protein phosphatase T [Nephila pilipes]|uniref:protein-tyrosine-phosphatase n=1 Tax=Nephila pilipes TaxID=299642 RepID=A0A8X6MV42_NEPPI|nr:receptor-type tyrosine-protein phosphatase T [Nephila pilipes]
MTLEIEDYDAPLGAERQYIVKLEDLEHYVKILSESKGFKEQYDMLRPGPQKACVVGMKPENKPKNRYPDLLPYDDSRVVLQKYKNDPNSDYINASYVDISNYIFHVTGWSVSAVLFANISILLGLIMVYQHNHLLLLMLDMNPSVFKRCNKMDAMGLHCSAGVGRSGTVMLLDSALEMSITEGKVDILGILYRMRQQRVNLIETEQYAFVYRALVEYHFGDISCKPANEMVLYFNKLRQLDPDAKKTGLELQFEKLRKLENPYFQQKCLTALTPNNKNKNRDPYILPPDDGRPVLKTSPPSNYINAIYAYHYGVQNHFVVTQYPLPNTVADFWQLLWDTGSSSIVVLNEISNKDEDDIWNFLWHPIRKSFDMVSPYLKTGNRVKKFLSHNSMENDPFKKRYPIKDQKRILLLSKEEINKIVDHAEELQKEEVKQKDAIEKYKKKVQGNKELIASFSQRKEPGSELRKKQFDLGTKFAKIELDRESRIEARKNLVLDQAYKRLFEQTDRVKYFKTAKNFDEMMKERDDQMETKLSHRDNQLKYDTEFLLKMLRDIDQYHYEEREQEKVKQRNKKQNAENLWKQRNELEQKKKVEKWEHLRNGYLLRDEDEQDVAKSEQKVRDEKEKVRKYKETLDHQVEDKEALFDIQQRLEKAEDIKAKLFNDAKREMTLEHKKIKEHIDKEKRDRKLNVANTINNEGAILKAKEAANLQKAVLEAEEKAQEENVMKQLKKSEDLEAFKKFYEQNVEAKEKRKYDERLKDYQEGRRIADNVDRLQKIEDAKMQNHGHLEKEVQHMQMHQIAKRQADKKDEEIEAMKDYMNHMRSLDNEEEMFQKYAQMEIENCEARGIDTYAMRRAARPGIECGNGPLFKNRGHIRPKYYASVWNPDDLTHIPQNQTLADTKSRLGFMLH